jgi:glyoxylate carboligase
MAEMRGCDLVVEYLIKEKVPYLFGYAGHGAVGLLDGVYNHQDELKIIFPRIESAAGYMADAYFRASGKLIPVYTSTGPGPMLLTVAMGNAFYDSSAFIAITGQVATNQYDSGALQEEYRHHQADFPSVAKVITKRTLPGAERRGPRQVPSEGVQARGLGPPRPGAHRRPLRPLDPNRRRRGARAGGALADAELAHAGLARGGRPGARAAAEG